MWHALWQDFVARASRLAAGTPGRDAIDATISWQLHGHADHAGSPMATSELQLPELYSGCPWRYGEHWVAFVGLNPSLDGEELYPTLAHHEGANDVWNRLVPFLRQPLSQSG